MDGVAGLKKLAQKYTKAQGDELYTYMELAVHGLSESDVINKDVLESSLSFRDLLANMLDDDDLFGDS